MKSNNILIILLFLALCVSSCKRKNVYSEENETDPRDNYEEVEFHQGSDGFKWYSARKDGKVVVLDSNMNEIIKPFDGRIDYRSEDSRFLKVRDYYTRDSTNKVSYLGLYSQKGEPIIHESNALSLIDIEHFYNIDRFFYHTAIRKGDHFYHGLSDTDGTVIIDNISSSPIEYKYKRKYSNIYEDGIAPMLIAEVCNEPYLTFKYIGENGEILSYGELLDKLSIFVDKMYTTGWGWIYGNKVSHYSGKAYVLEDCIFVLDDENKNSLELLYYKFDYSHEEDGYQVYRNNKNIYAYLSPKVIRFDPYFLCGGEKYTYTTNSCYNNSIDKECQKLKEYHNLCKNYLNTGDIDRCYQLQNSNRSKNGASYQSVNPSYNPISGNEQVYPEETTELYEEQETRQPIRNRCQACHKNPGSCSVCNGSRKVEYRYISSTGEWIMKDCPTCHGSGICQSCKGDGWIDEGIDF